MWRLEIRCQNFLEHLCSLPTSSGPGWLCLSNGEHTETARCLHWIRSSCTASEAATEQKNTMPAFQFWGCCRWVFLSCPLFEQGYMGFKQNPMASSVVSFFFFLLIFSLGPTWPKAAVSKKQLDNGGTCKKSYPEIDALFYTGSIRKELSPYCVKLLEESSVSDEERLVIHSTFSCSG